MKNISFLFATLLLFCLSSCTAIEGIFKAGFAVGIIAVVLVIALIIWIVSMFRKQVIQFKQAHISGFYLAPVFLLGIAKPGLPDFLPVRSAQLAISNKARYYNRVSVRLILASIPLFRLVIKWDCFFTRLQIMSRAGMLLKRAK